jgi:hypothetical protein
MKKILWCLPEREISFELNWFEYFILKRIFNKRKYTLLKRDKIKGQRFNTAVIDEFCDIDEKYFMGVDFAKKGKNRSFYGN